MQEVQEKHYQSKFRELVVTFPEERYGLGKNARGDDVPWADANFFDGRFSTDSPKMIEQMDEHKSNAKNGGESFWEIPPADISAQRILNGEAFAHTEDIDLSQEDYDILNKLALYAKSIKPNQVQDVERELILVTTRFNIRGLPKMKKNPSIQRLRGRVIEVLGVLEDQEIYKESKNEN